MVGSRARSPLHECSTVVTAVTWITDVFGSNWSSSRRNIDIHSISLAAAANATYSISTELFTTVSWSQEDQLQVNPSTANTYPDVEQWQFHNPAQLELAHPVSTYLLPVTFAVRVASMVPFRYLKIRLAVIRCSLNGLAANQAHWLTAKAISGRVPCVIQSSEPTSEA